MPTRTPEPLALPATLNQSWSIDFMSDSLFCDRRFRTFNIVAWRGYLKQLRMDNGAECISTTLAECSEEHDIKLGIPTQSSYVERFNRTYRDEILNMYVFKTLNEVRELTENWIREYNEERPYDSLNELTLHNKQENSNLECH